MTRVPSFKPQTRAPARSPSALLRGQSGIVVSGIGLVALALMAAPEFAARWGGKGAPRSSLGTEVQLRGRPFPAARPAPEARATTAPLQAPYRLVLDAVSVDGAPSSGLEQGQRQQIPFGVTAILENTLYAMGMELSPCLRYRDAETPREPMAYDVVLQPRSDAVRVVSVPQNQAPRRSGEVACLRDTLETLKSSKIAEASEGLGSALRLRVFVVLVAPGSATE